MRYARPVCLAFLAALPACATIVEGTGQDLTIDTTPAGASCTVDRDGKRLGMVAPTPGSMRIDKSKNDIAVTCAKPGYATATVSQSPKFVGTTFGNLLLGGVVGVVVDASTGANYVYPGTVKLDMAPVTATPMGLPVAPLAGAAPAS